MSLTEEIKDKALELGYIKAGITSAEDFSEYYDELLSRENYRFFKKGRDQNSRLKNLFPEAKSILSVAYGFSHIKFPEKLTTHVGRVYQARCYVPPKTNINGARFELLKEFIKGKGINILEGAFLPERAVAARAGITTYGKNNFAYADGYGSFIVLCSIVMDRELEWDTPTVRRACPKNCRLCIDACPTQALNEPGKLNPSQCIAFNHWFTQEGKAEGISTEIPVEIREKIGCRIHGCDLCQEVCPRNQSVITTASEIDPFLEKLSMDFDLEKILFLEAEYYEKEIKPIMYNYIKDYRYFRRNAAIAMGNSKNKGYIPALEKAAMDMDTLVSSHAKWALDRLKDEKASLDDL